MPNTVTIGPERYFGHSARSLNNYAQGIDAKGNGAQSISATYLDASSSSCGSPRDVYAATDGKHNPECGVNSARDFEISS